MKRETLKYGKADRKIKRKPKTSSDRFKASASIHQGHVKQSSRKTSRLATKPLLSGGALRFFLDDLMDRYHRDHWLSSDPIQFAHQYTNPDDQEIAAFIAACFAYGSVPLIRRAVQTILAPMGRSPAAFVASYDGSNAWPGFYYRFHTSEHVKVLMTILREALQQYGSLQNMFKKNQPHADKFGSAFERLLTGGATWLRTQASNQIEHACRPELLRGMKFLFNSPSDGSACKRMVMFIRWMVRKDEIDLGLWNCLAPSELVIPADTHVARIAFYLGLRKGHEAQPANWKMAREITSSLSVVNPDDPVAYDFAIARLGILDICKRTYSQSICSRCPVQPACRFGQENVA